MTTRTDHEEILECQRFLRACCLAVLAVFWIPFVLLALDIAVLEFLSSILLGLMIGGPVVVMLVTVWLAVRFLRAIPEPAVKEHWSVLIVAWLTCLPFLGLLGPVGCLQQVQSYLGRSPGVLPVSLPNRRCRCGGEMSMNGGQQWVKLWGKTPVGFIANFGCGRCRRSVEIPSLEVMAMDLVSFFVFVSLALGGSILVFGFIRQPAEDVFAVINEILVLLLALGAWVLVGILAFRSVRRLVSRLRYRESRADR